MVSVIIPIYNVEKYLRQCVDSVISQTYRDLEIILVDDGSPDGCGSICDEYAVQDSRITVIHKENGGLSDARNAGLEIAKGEYIYFLDSDDYIKNDAIEKLVARIEEENADFVYFDAETLFEDFEDENYNEEFIRSQYYRTSDGASVLASHIKHEEYFSCVVLLFLRTEFIKNKKLNFYKGIIHEDELFTPFTFLKAERAAYLKEPLYIRRLRAGSIMSGKTSLKSMQGLEVCIGEYYKAFLNFQFGKLERKILSDFMYKRLLDITYIYPELDSRRFKRSVAEIEQMNMIAKKFQYFGSRKLKIKLKYPKTFRCYCQLKSLFSR